MKGKKIFTLVASVLVSMTAWALDIKDAGGWFESGYVTWNLIEDAAGYRVSVIDVEAGTEKVLDGALVRSYGTYGRADAVGLRAGSYRFKVTALNAEGEAMENEAAETEVQEVKGHDRAGFAHFNYKGVGAYNDDGTLKTGAKVIYVTAATAKTVTCDLVVDSKGKVQTFTGLQTILDGKQKGYDTTPLAVRVIGTIEAEDMDRFSSSSEGLQLKGKRAESEMNVTIEGVGNDAAIRGFGILMRNCKSVEIRNLGIMLCMDDCISIDSDNSHCWVHHVDFFYGQTGGDSDQAKGDGSLDCKGDSKYMTFSYNHFWDCGKMALCGMTSESGENFISYHHNWFDHSDSRHPRVRTMTVHVYNNYFDGVSKYGVGATMGSNVFVESNYFRNTNRPMMISLQGTDISGDGKGTFSGENGGMIKAYGNVYAEKSANFRLVTHKQSSTGFDCYEADARDEQVPATYRTLVGGTTYNNFDTDSQKMYAYTPDKAEDVPDILTGKYGAGRMQRGDFHWLFDNSVDDTDYEVNTALKAALAAYQSTLAGSFSAGGNVGDEGNNGGDDEEPVFPDTPEEPGTPVEPADGDYSCHFTGGAPSNTFYTISGNYSKSKGQATVNGQTYTWCLKIESSTTVDFTIDKAMTLTLVFAEGSVPNIKVDGEKLTATDSHIITCELNPGTHRITKANSHNLFYINLLPTMANGVEMPFVNGMAEPVGLYYDLMGRPVSHPTRGIYIKNGKKVRIGN